MTRGAHLLTAVIVAAACAGCDRENNRSGTDASTLRLLYDGDERQLFAGLRFPAQFLLFLPLVAHDERHEIEGRLARAWSHSDDHRDWTFHLRTDVRWHDGVPVTAHDVKFTFELFDAMWGTTRGADVTVHDDSTLTIRSARPTDALDWWMVYYPRHLLERLDPADFDDWDFWRRPVGNGPYRYVRHIPRTTVELAANPDYYRGKPRIERVILRAGASAVTELLSGNVDVMGVGWGDLAKLGGDPRFNVYGSASGWLGLIFWDHRDPLFADVRVRRALTHAIDRPELHQALHYPTGLPVFDGLITSRQYERGDVLPGLPHDPNAARRLLEDAGWVARDRSGVLEKDGRDFRFTALVPSESADRMRAAVLVQAQLRRVGVRMEVRPLDTSAVRARLEAGDFQAVFFRMQWEPAPRLGALNVFGRNSLVGYANPRVAALLERADTTAHPAAMDGIYAELMTIFQADAPATFLYPEISPVVAHERVRGLRSGFFAGPATRIDRLWLEDTP